MTFARRRAVASLSAFAVLALGGLFSHKAAAQDVLASAPPLYSDVDPQYVDLGSGALTLTMPGLAVGQPGAGGMSYGRNWIGTGWRDTLMGSIDSSGSVYTVSIGGSSESFNAANGVFTNAGGGASTLTVDSSGQIFTYTLADGTVATFEKSMCCNIGLKTYTSTASNLGNASQGRITSMVLPSGEVRTWNYIFVNFGSDAPSDARKYRIGRLQSVTNNFGYQIRYLYAKNFGASDTPYYQDESKWAGIIGVVGFNMADETCDPSAQQCASVENNAKWPKVTYSSSGTYFTVTDNVGRSTRYTYGSGQVVAIRRPTSGDADNLTVAYDGSGRVSSVNNGVGTWTYGYSDSGNTRTTTVTDPLQHQRVVTSDLMTGLMLTDRDALGHTTTYTYDGSHRLWQVTAPEGDYVTFDHDGRGNITKRTRYGKPGSNLPGSNLVVWSEATYEEGGCSNPKTCNKPSSSHDDNGHNTYYTYDPNHGGVLTVTRDAPSSGAAQPQVRYSYGSYQARYKDGNGKWISGSAVYRPTGTSTCVSGSSCAGTSLEAKTVIEYGDTSQPNNLLPVSVTQSAGDNSVSATTTLTYDTVGNRLTVTGPANTGTTRYRYDNARQVVGVTGPSAGASRQYRAVSIDFNADGQVTEARQGTVSSQADGDWSNFMVLQKQKTSYDSQGRKTRSALTDASDNELMASTYGYDNANHLTAATRLMYGAGADRSTTYSYDAAGRVTQALGNGQSIAAASYTDDGLQSSVMDGNGNITNYSYDGYNRVNKVTYPSVNGASSYETFTYDNASQVQSHRLRDGQTVNFGIDALERVTSRDMGGYSYSYDNLGRVTQVSASGDPTVSMTYDALGRVTSQQTGNRTVSAQYDAAGRLIQLTWPDNFSVTYGYDATGAMTTVSDSTGTQVVTYSYDDLGRRVSLERNNGMTTSYGYDSASRLTSQNWTGRGANQSLSFGYNAAGQITSRSNSDPAYDPPAPESGTTNYALNALNQTMQASGNVPTLDIGYDGRGNLSSYGSTTLGYNADNQLTSMSPATTLGYDALGRLAQVSQSSTTNFLYFGDQLLAEYDASGTVLRRYVPGAATDETVVWYEGATLGLRRYIIPDERGSTMAVVDEFGTKLAANTYDEYGRPGPNNLGRFQYTGQIWLSEIGAYHYKARVYIPGLGRFAQADPSGYSAGMNLYAYAGGDPINNTDPTGLQSCMEDGSCKTGREFDPDSAFRNPTIWGPAPGWTSLSDFGNWSGGNGPWSGVLSAPDLNGGLASAKPQSPQQPKQTDKIPTQCMLDDGTIVPYQDNGDGTGTISGVGESDGDSGTGVAVGQSVTETAMPTAGKAGGIAGGGISGPVTSPASITLRGMTGNARFRPLGAITGTTSIGGSIGRALPFLGTALSALSFFGTLNAIQHAPTCRPIA
ncbi:RHS repeat-associated protein [Nitrospirillum amazonense]|uniref:RHS repeat-associated protein n=1 Tax=Nitrospirillum amazonense TaxID=28077 RepID=A0A560EJX8_9PROT|nr:RHS repeat-associated core domain-containing protein [Nitrospirillum amazonense]TWB09656.1 RHS repeat-associated protein [Nitrospirillum amazonense]